MSPTPPPLVPPSSAAPDRAPPPSPDPPAADPDRAIRSLTWRLWAGIVLAVPILGLSLAGRAVPGSAIDRALSREANLTAQAALCTPVVLVCGWPLLAGAWASVRARRPTIFTLYGLGIGAAFGYSLAAAVYAWSDTRPLPRGPEPEPEKGGAALIAKLRQPGIGERVGERVAGQLRAVAPYREGVVEPFFESAAGIVVFALFGMALELRAKRRTGEAVRKLLRLAPPAARVVLADGREEDRPRDKLRPGDVVRVAPGARFPVDGVVVAGISHVDESAVTGEPERVGKEPGDEVTAGTENGLGELTVEAVHVAGDTLLDRVAAVVGRAQQDRVPPPRAADRLAARLVPLVLGAAAATFAGWWAFGPPGAALPAAAVCAVGVLVIACPCALGLATPAAVVAGMGRAARAGVLFRDPAAVEQLAAVDTILFDKTGTLTAGRPKVVGVEPAAGVSPNEVLALAAAVERGTEHPLGRAVVWEAVGRGLGVAEADGVEGVPGKGVRGTVDGCRVVVGTAGFLQGNGVHQDLMIAQAHGHRLRGRGVIFVGRDTRCVGLVLVSDALRATAAAAVARLKDRGVHPVLVTGDDAATASAVARAVGIAEVVAGTAPVEKYAVVRRLKGAGRVVAVCGDGVNDAPALAAADVGIAVASGTEAAVTAAGVTLVGHDLRAVAAAREVSRATGLTIRENVLLASGFNLLAVPVAAGVLVPVGGGLVSPPWVVAAIGVSSLAVLANSLRLRFRGVVR